MDVLRVAAARHCDDRRQDPEPADVSLEPEKGKLRPEACSARAQSNAFAKKGAQLARNSRIERQEIVPGRCQPG